MINKIRGTQDFLDTTSFKYLIKTIEEHLKLYNYRFIMTPILESIDLFQRSLGTSTDVVSKEMYLAYNPQATEKACLRPEGTAGIARAFIENGIQVLPWKVYTFGPMFRYERPQKGRFRQFHQVSIETIGAASFNYDVEIINMLYDLFIRKLNLNNSVLLLNYLGSKDDRLLHREALVEYLLKNQSLICNTCLDRTQKNPLRVFDCKNEACQQIYKDAPLITNYLSELSKYEWREVQNNLNLLSVNFIHEPRLVRGLDYYNKTVFEFVSTDLGAQATYCGGGRYDGLISELKPNDFQPALGAGIGIERLLMLIEPPVIKNDLIIVLPLSQAQHALALMFTDELRAKNLNCEIFFDGSSIKSMMRKADKSGAVFAIIFGDDEQATQTVTIKNLVNSESIKLLQNNGIDFLINNLK
jgi:histidyl-tRNA synthetase